MKIKATIDRFDKDKAVLIVGESEDEFIVPRASLPNGVVQGLWLLVEVKEHRIINAVIDDKETDRVEKRIAGKIASLKRKRLQQ